MQQWEGQGWEKGAHPNLNFEFVNVSRGRTVCPVNDKGKADMRNVFAFRFLHFPSFAFLSTAPCDILAHTNQSQRIHGRVKLMSTSDHSPGYQLMSTQRSGERYFLWTDIQETLKSYNHLRTYRGMIAQFMVDGDGEL